MVDSTEEALANDMDPDAVGEMVVDAALANQFYVLPNSAHFEPALEADFVAQIRSFS